MTSLPLDADEHSRIFQGHPDEIGKLLDSLRDAVEAFETGVISYAVIGGIASARWGRPRWTGDVDVFVRREDASKALDALDAFGFKTEKTDPRWLYKAFKDDVLVDVIFMTGGDIEFDEEMITRSYLVNFGNLALRIISPEDLFVTKVMTHDEQNPRHWHDAMGIVARSDLDWDYLLKRATYGPHRVLSALLYAQSEDLPVPDSVLDRFFTNAYGNGSKVGSS